jgi:rhodanese-related sulfurtransferase
MSTLPRTLLESLLIAASGLGLGVLGNGLNPAGLRVERDYFPRGAAPAPTAAAQPAQPAPTEAARAQEAAADVESAALARLAEHGLQGIRFDEARALFEDPLYAAGALLFIDARHDEDYAEGHVPGALQFDHYHAERYLDAVLAAAPGTSRIVIYCNGGHCEDSEFAAATLGDFLPDPARICVYVGGIEEWRARGMPVETGERGSGVLEAAGK